MSALGNCCDGRCRSVSGLEGGMPKKARPWLRRAVQVLSGESAAVELRPQTPTTTCVSTRTRRRGQRGAALARSPWDRMGGRGSSPW